MAAAKVVKKGELAAATSRGKKAALADVGARSWRACGVVPSSDWLDTEIRRILDRATDKT